MKYEFPIKHYENNLIFSDTGCWAVYELEGYDYDNLSVESKMKVLRNFTNFFGDIISDIKIHIIPTKQNFEENIRATYRGMRDDDPLKGIAEQYAEGHIEYLKSSQVKKIVYDKDTGEQSKVVSDEVDDFKFYIDVKLEDLGEKDYLKNIKDCVEYMVLDPKRALDELLGLRGVRILDSKIRAFKKASYAYFETQRQRVGLKEVDDKVVQWLYRRTNYRGLNSKVDVTDFAPKGRRIINKENEIEIEPIIEEISCLFRGKISQHDRYLEIATTEGTSYQSFLSLTEKPTMRFPGSEYIFMLQKINARVEACIYIKKLDKHNSEKVVLEHRKKISSEIDNANEGHIRIDENTKEAMMEVSNMEEEVRINKALTQTSITFVVADDNLEEMEKTVSKITNIYKDNEMILERSIADQYKLYLECIPGTDRYTKDFARLMSIKNIAGTGIGATRLLGDEKGFYIGTTGELQKKVFLDMARAPLENKSASATFYGDLGYGKSFNANLMLLLQVLFGGYALIFDPKGERSNWGESLPWLKPLISVTSLNSDEEYRGMLDPFSIYNEEKDIEEACSLAQNIVSELINLDPKDDESTVLKEALVEIKKKKNRSMTLLTEILDKAGEDKDDEFAKHSRKLARNLKALKNIGMTKLIFGTGNEKALDFNNRINILQISNLKMPSADVSKEDYSDEEVISATLMMIMSQFAKRFALTPMPNFKVVLFDESWFLKGTAEGLKLYDFLTRMGRSLFTGCIFNGHSVLDIPNEKIQNTISYKFCFHTDEEKEARRMCEYLKIDVSRLNIERIMKLENRECMFSDLDGRVGKLRFDAVYDNVIECFNTTPKTALEEN